MAWRAMDEFEKLYKLGEGAYGKVYKAREKTTGRIVAIRKIKLLEDNEDVPARTLWVLTQLGMLSFFTHIVRLSDFKEGQNKRRQSFLYLVFEYMDTDLNKYIRGFRQNQELIPSQIVKTLMFQLCKVIAFCHDQGVLHSNLKPHNILMDRKTMMLKIADVGFSEAFTFPIKKYTHKINTLWYKAPEVLLGAETYASPADIWSVGCIFAELVTTQPLFAGHSVLLQLLQIYRLLGAPNEQVWPGVSKLANFFEYPRVIPPKSLSIVVPTLDADGIDLLSKMLQYDPSKRISGKQAIEHPYFDGLEKDSL